MLLKKIRPKVKMVVKNPNGSIDVFFKNKNLLPINIALDIETTAEKVKAV